MGGLVVMILYQLKWTVRTIKIIAPFDIQSYEQSVFNMLDTQISYPAAKLMHSTRGGARNLFFSLLGGANHANLYKNLIKIQMFNVNLGTIGGARPLPAPPISAPALNHPA